MLENREIILASASPKRRQILEQIGVDFKVVVSEVSELNTADSVEELVKKNAELKVGAVIEKFQNNSPLGRPSCMVIGADTVVVSGDNIFFKPKNMVEAQAMFEAYKQNHNKVVTGLCLWVPKVKSSEQNNFENNNKSNNIVSEVDFYESVVDVSHFRFNQHLLYQPREEIELLYRSLIDLNKSGGFSIEGRAAMFFDSIEGSFYNILGLPLHRLLELTHRAGVSLFSSINLGDSIIYSTK